MRVFVFLLILANLLFLVWTQGYFGSSPNPDAFRVRQQLLPERLTVVARGEPPPESIKTEIVPKPAEVTSSGPNAGASTPAPIPVAGSGAPSVCLQITDLPPADGEMLASALAEKLPAFKLQRMPVAASGSYWVNIPPLASKQEADVKAAELKKLNVPEFFVVNESGPNNHAISLGLFSRRDAAQVQLDMLRGKGVKSAKITERNVKPASLTLEMQGPENQADALRQAVAELLPESKALVCKGPSATPQ